MGNMSTSISGYLDNILINNICRQIDDSLKDDRNLKEDKTLEPGKYCVVFKSLATFSMWGIGFVIWPGLVSNLSRLLFNMPKKQLKDDIAYCVRTGNSVFVGIYTKEIAETLVNSANQILSKFSCTPKIKFYFIKNG